MCCSQAHAEQQLQEVLAQKQAEASKLQDQMRDLKLQNQKLHEELERAAGQHATAAADAAGLLRCVSIVQTRTCMATATQDVWAVAKTPPSVLSGQYLADAIHAMSILSCCKSPLACLSVSI